MKTYTSQSTATPTLPDANAPLDWGFDSDLFSASELAEVRNALSWFSFEEIAQ